MNKTKQRRKKLARELGVSTRTSANIIRKREQERIAEEVDAEQQLTHELAEIDVDPLCNQIAGAPEAGPVFGWVKDLAWPLGRPGR